MQPKRQLSLAIFTLLLAIELVVAGNFFQETLGWFTKNVIKEANENYATNMVVVLHKDARDIYMTVEGKADYGRLQLKLDGIEKFSSNLGNHIELLISEILTNFSDGTDLNEAKDIRVKKAFKRFNYDKYKDIKRLREIYDAVEKIHAQITEIEKVDKMKKQTGGERTDVYIGATELRNNLLAFIKMAQEYEKIFVEDSKNYFQFARGELKNLENNLNAKVQIIRGFRQNIHNGNSLEKANAKIDKLKHSLLKLNETISGGNKSDEKLTIVSLLHEKFIKNRNELTNEIEELNKFAKILQNYKEYDISTKYKLKYFTNTLSALEKVFNEFDRNYHNLNTLGRATESIIGLRKVDLPALEKSIPVKCLSNSDDQIVSAISSAKKEFVEESEKLSNKINEMKKIVGILEKDKVEFKAYKEFAKMTLDKFEDDLDKQLKEINTFVKNDRNRHTIDKANKIGTGLRAQLLALRQSVGVKIQPDSDDLLSAIVSSKGEFVEECEGLKRGELRKIIEMLESDKIEFAKYDVTTKRTIERLEKDVKAKVDEVAGFVGNDHNKITLKTAKTMASDLNAGLRALKESVPVKVQPDNEDIVGALSSASTKFEKESEELAINVKELGVVIGILRNDKEIDNKVKHIKAKFVEQFGKYKKQLTESEADTITAIIEAIHQTENDIAMLDADLKSEVEDTLKNIAMANDEIVKLNEKIEREKIKKEELEAYKSKIDIASKRATNAKVGIKLEIPNVTGALTKAITALTLAQEETQSELDTVKNELDNLKISLESKIAAKEKLKEYESETKEIAHREKKSLVPYKMKLDNVLVDALKKKKELDINVEQQKGLHPVAPPKPPATVITEAKTHPATEASNVQKAHSHIRQDNAVIRVRSTRR